MSDWTRRDVLRMGAVGALAGVGATAQAQTSSAAEPIRTGFIGIGHRGMYLLERYLTLEGHRVVALCDIHEEFVDKGKGLVEKAQGHVPDGYAGDSDVFKKLLERKDIDAIVSATPCYEHARIFLTTIQAGKHIYGEKPLALTVADADAIVAAAEARPKLVVQVGFQWMLHPTMVEAVSRVHKGQIGGLIEGRFHRHNPNAPMTGWFGRRAQSGDWMLEQACHEYNVMGWVAQGTPLRAFALGRRDIYTEVQKDRNVTDYYSVILEYPKGFTVHYTHGWISPAGFEGMAMQIIGDKGAVDIFDGRISLGDKKAKAAPIAKFDGNDTDEALRSFIKSVREGKPAAAPVTNGRNASLTGLLVRKAVDERGMVTWEQMLKSC